MKISVSQRVHVTGLGADLDLEPGEHDVPEGAEAACELLIAQGIATVVAPASAKTKTKGVS